MERVGVISGAFVMEKSDLIRQGGKRRIRNQYGDALVVENDRIVFILRHGDDPDDYILPHRINHHANLQALQDLGVTCVIGINSTGSLKTNLRPGMIVIPDDFITLAATPSIYHNKAVHITPSLNEAVRQKLITAAHDCNLDVVETGTYWQVAGPRLETRAEIRMMSHFADIVGMTMAHEFRQRPCGKAPRHGGNHCRDTQKRGHDDEAFEAVYSIKGCRLRRLNQPLRRKLKEN